MPQGADDTDVGLDQVLAGVVDANPDRLTGWIRNEPGHWGFFAGQAVREVRQLIGRRLEDQERRFVWHRMWQILSERKRESMEMMGE